MVREYKDSGIEWIGDVPTHWKVMPLKRTGSFENGLTYSPADICDENGVLVLRSSNIQNDKLNFEDKVYVAKCPLSLLVHSGDIVICSRNGSASLVGKCAMIEGNINATYGAFMMRYRPNYKSNKAFSFYLLQTALQCYKGLYSTTTINQLTKGVIGQIYVSYPPLSEQRAIASYLDTKCAEIDSLVELQEQMIAQLTDYKQSVITEAVTKGLNPEAELVPSGIDWIGDVPRKWRVNKVNRLFGIIGSGTTPNSSDDDAFVGSINWLQSGDINGGIITNACKKISNDTLAKYSVLSVYKAPFIIVAMYGASVGNISISQIDACVNQACCVLSDSQIDFTYAFYAIKSAQRYLIFRAVGGGQPNISQYTLRQLWIPEPPLEEQQSIASYLNTKCAEIDSLIDLKRQKIEALKDYKKSIIFEAVTGKTNLEET